MVFLKVIAALACVGVVWGRADQLLAPGYAYPAPPSPHYHHPAPAYPTHENKGMPYDFAYGVKDDYTGNNYGHNENSDGNTVTGEYSVLLPDGRTQIVTYTADHHTGYVAKVSFEGEATYPALAPYPLYGAP
ncbi:cuticle protein 19-like [Homarus americanus]|uniref:cuticle protein 19-like n=1 Tax=Homarus americanus TaxID=6706 RepID=UPI001C48D054|nr:cuticle protein 19-like [Homarus americanus]